MCAYTYSIFARSSSGMYVYAKYKLSIFLHLLKSILVLYFISSLYSRDYLC